MKEELRNKVRNVRVVADGRKPNLMAPGDYGERGLTTGKGAKAGAKAKVLVMTRFRLLLILTAIGLLAGCATTVPIIDFYDAEAETLERFPTIDILAEADLGAHAISEPHCLQSQKTDLTNNCWGTIVCESDAFEVTGEYESAAIRL